MTLVDLEMHTQSKKLLDTSKLQVQNMNNSHKSSHKQDEILKFKNVQSQ
jgi:hypothetical protein